MRKPAVEAFDCVASHLQLPASRCIFVDDRQPNIDGARAAGMAAVKFESAAQLEAALQQLGVPI
jgi:putative hydrolase of the HAD superfamily